MLSLIFSLFFIFQTNTYSASCLNPDEKKCQTQSGSDSCSNNCYDQKNRANLKSLSSKILFSPEGLALVEKLKKENFTCDEDSIFALKRGILCKGLVSSYSQPVRFYISPNYKIKQPPVIDLHFHGHRLTKYDTF